MQYGWTRQSIGYCSWHVIVLLLIAISVCAQPDITPPPGGGGGGGSGDITDVYNCSTGNCSNIALTDGDYLDMSAVNATTAEGLRLPQNTTCSLTTPAGITCWDTDDATLYISTGSASKAMGDITSIFDCSAGACTGFAISDGQLIDFSSVEITATTEGLILPGGDSSGEDCSANTAEGQICWDYDDDALFVGTDGAARQMGLITSIYDCTEGACGSSLAVSDGNVLDFSSVDISTTGEGIILPQATDCSGGTTEGQICWDTDDNMLFVGNASSTTAMGDITDVFSCSSGDCSSITVADGDLLNFSGVTISSATEGIILPGATDCSSGTAEGQTCWDTDNDELNIGTGASTITLGGGGAGDITDVYNCSTGDCASIAMADGDFLDMSSVSVTTTTEGLRLPKHATDCSAATAEGQVCWQEDTNSLFVGDGATANDISQSSVDLDTAFDNGKVIDGANNQANGLRVGDGTDYWGFYIGTNACVQECVVGGSPSDVQVNVASGNSYILDLDSSAGTLTADADTGAVTLAGTLVEVKPAPFPAGMMVPDGTQCQENSNQTLNSTIVKSTITCTDNNASTMQFSFPAPASWDESTLTITQHMFINDTNVDGVVEFDWVGYCAGDNDPWFHGTYTAEDANSVLTFDGSGYAQNDGVSATTAGSVPIGSCSEGDMIFLQGSVDATATVATSIAELHTLWVDVNITYVNWSD